MTFSVETFENHTSFDYSCFQNIFIALLNKHAPIKKKIMRFNINPFMSKALRKAIMHSSKFKNIYNKYRTVEPNYYRGKRVSHCNEYLFREHNREFRSIEGWWLIIKSYKLWEYKRYLRKTKINPVYKKLVKLLWLMKNYLLNSWRKIW